jgi:cation transport ATPase
MNQPPQQQQPVVYTQQLQQQPVYGDVKQQSEQMALNPPQPQALHPHPHHHHHGEHHPHHHHPHHPHHHHHGEHHHPHHHHHGEHHPHHHHHGEHHPHHHHPHHHHGGRRFQCKKWKKRAPHAALVLYIIANLVTAFLAPISIALGVLNLIVVGVAAFAFKKKRHYLLAGAAAILVYKLTDIAHLVLVGSLSSYSYSHGHYHRNRVLIFSSIATYVLQVVLLVATLIRLRRVFKKMKAQQSLTVLPSLVEQQQPQEQTVVVEQVQLQSQQPQQFSQHASVYPVVQQPVVVQQQQPVFVPVQQPHKFAAQLKTLQEMGFHNDELHIQMLDKHNGNVIAVVREIIGQ